MNKKTSSERIHYVALLRGVNVGKTKRVGKEALIKAFENAGMENVRSYIQSGNLVFESIEEKLGSLQESLEKELQKETGHEITVVLRTRDQLAALAKKDPLDAKKNNEDKDTNVFVAFLSEKPKAADIKKLLARRHETEQFEVHGTEAISVFPRKPDDRTPYAINFVEKELACAATVRNWNTVMKLATL